MEQTVWTLESSDGNRCNAYPATISDADRIALEAGEFVKFNDETLHLVAESALQEI
jgi:hypothetical protein